MCGSYRICQVGGHLGFNDIAERTGRQGFPHIVRILVNGQKDDSYSGFRFRQTPYGLDSAHSRHRYVDNQNIGLQTFGFIYGFLTIAYGANNIKLPRQCASDRVQNGFVIVCKIIGTLPGASPASHAISAAEGPLATSARLPRDDGDPSVHQVSGH